MQVHPAIALLRSEGASQHRPAPRAKAAMDAAREAWLAASDTAAIAQDMGRYGGGAALGECHALAQLLDDHAAASGWVGGLCLQMQDALRAHPLGEAPFRHTASRGLSSLRLIERAGAALTLSAYEPVTTAAVPASAVFADREAQAIVIAGEARGLIHRMAAAPGEPGAVASRAHHWRGGDRIVTRALTDSRQIIAVERSLLLLQLTCEPRRPRPSLEVALASGAVLRRASGDKAASQAVMALGVLGALGDTRALEVMEATALNRAEDSEVRWEAVRQTLALGPMRGLALLRALGEDNMDPLADPAQALRRDLLETRPELRLLAQESA